MSPPVCGAGNIRHGHVKVILELYPLCARHNALGSGARSIAPRIEGQQLLPLASARGWHGIPKPKGHELNHPRLVTVRQMTTLMPAAKTLNLFCFG